jgi:hypothetical protein
MSIAQQVRGLWIKSSLAFACATAVSIHSCVAFAENDLPAAPDSAIVRELPGHFPEKPSIPPSWNIPVEPLGFSAPGLNYLGMRNAMLSLDFLGENRLLFTFRVPGLMRREPGSTASDQRQIRAVVLELPSGAVLSETNWTVHDRFRYLWAVDDDHFLLRDRNTIFQGDIKLNREPILQFPGSLASVQLSPGRQYIVTNSQEPPQSAASKKGSGAAPAPRNNSSSDDDAEGQPQIVLRILRRDSHQVLFVTHIRNPIELPMNADGFLSAQRANGVEWNVDLNYFTGQSRTLNKVKSACAPEFDFLSETQALVTACSSSDDNAIVSITTAGTVLWTDLINDRLIWPLIVTSRSGLRFARESLFLSHAISGFNPMSNEDIKGQWVRVFDSATGLVAFESPATPILDAGGNVAISPSGRRVAVVNAGSIQVFELPPPPALPAALPDTPAH